MSRNIAAAVTIGLVTAAFIIFWSGLVHVEPETAASVTRADAAEKDEASPRELAVSIFTIANFFEDVPTILHAEVCFREADHGGFRPPSYSQLFSAGAVRLWN
jgi:hypothetical protein